MSNIKLKYKTLPEIDAAIGRIENRYRATHNELHAINMGVLAHVREHGDKTVADQRVERITKIDGITKGKVRQWFEFALNADMVEGAFEYRKNASHRDIDLAKADAVKWYNFKADSQPQPAKTLLELFESFHKAAKRSVDKGAITEEQLETVERAFVRASKQQESAEVIELPAREDKAA